jgi:hypothetical protein
MTIDTDLFVVVGLLVAALSLPSALSAFADERFPYVALLVFVLGLGTGALGIYGAQGDYSLARVPHSFVEILARIMN